MYESIRDYRLMVAIISVKVFLAFDAIYYKCSVLEVHSKHLADIPMYIVMLIRHILYLS